MGRGAQGSCRSQEESSERTGRPSLKGTAPAQTMASGELQEGEQGYLGALFLFVFKWNISSAPTVSGAKEVLRFDDLISFSQKLTRTITPILQETNWGPER